MGLDLTLLPFDCDQGDFAFSHTLLSCERRGDLFEVVMEKAPGRAVVPPNFKSFTGRCEKCEDTHYGTTVETPYGEPLEWVEVEDLLKLGQHIAVKDDYKNRAIWAYLKELPARTKVALYWH